MAGYGEGIRTGLDLGRTAFQGVNTYLEERNRVLSYRDRLAQQAQDHTDAAKALKVEADKYSDMKFEKEVADDRTQGKESFNEQAERLKLSETSRHNKAMEALQPIIHPPKAVSGSGMTPYQKTQAASRASKNYLSAKNAGDENGMSMYGKALTELGVPLPNAPVAEKLGLFHPINDAQAAGHWLGGLMGGAAASQPPLTGGAKLPGLD